MSAIQHPQEMGITQGSPQQGLPAYNGDNKAMGQYVQQPQQPQYPQASAQPQQQYTQNYQQGMPPQQANMAYAQQGAQGGGAMVVQLNSLGDVSQAVDCPYCQRRTVTRVESHASSMTIVAGVLVGLVCICLFWIPCAAHWLYDTEWYCASCGAKLAYKQHDSSPVVCHLAAPTAVQSQYAGNPQQVQQQQQQQPPPKQ